MSTLGENIFMARHEAGLTQKELAQKVGVPYQTIQFWERGQRNPKLENVKRIAEALNIRWEELYPESQKSTAEVEDIFDFVNQMAAHKTQLANSKTDAQEKRLLQHFRNLNTDGQSVAVDRVEELAQIPKYQRAQNASQDAPAGADDKEPAEK